MTAPNLSVGPLDLPYEDSTNCESPLSTPLSRPLSTNTNDVNQVASALSAWNSERYLTWQ